MNPELLTMLDLLRSELDTPVNLLESTEGFARKLGSGNKSQHNVDLWLYCNAVDGYIPDSITYREFYEAAREVGFTGIGLYKGWSHRGFHVDVRPDRDRHAPATWAGFYNARSRKTTYKSIRELINA